MCFVDLNNNILSFEECYEWIEWMIMDDVIWEFICGSFLELELIEEFEFKDVDVLFYDFDVFNGLFLIDFDEFCSVWNFGLISVVVWSLFLRCSDSVKFERVIEYIYDEFD